MNIRSLLLIVALLLAGCADESFTGAELTQAEGAQAAAKQGQRVFVLNTQLRPVEGDNPSRARGHLQLKLRQVSGVTPDPFRPVLNVFDGLSSRGIIVVKGRELLPAAQAEALIRSPEHFVALFMTEAHPGGALGGRFHKAVPGK